MKREKVFQVFKKCLSLFDDPIIYKTLFRSSPNAIMLLNADASIQKVNHHSFSKLTGYDKEEYH